MKIFISFLAMLSSAAFAQSEPKMQVAVNAQIAQLNHFLECDIDADCVAVPFGAKACGGPQTYVVASKLNPHLWLLQRAAQQSVDTQRAENIRQSAMSTCSIVIPPVLTCVRHQCVGASGALQ